MTSVVGRIALRGKQDVGLRGKDGKSDLLTDWPSRVIRCDHVDAVVEILFEFLDGVGSGEASRDAADDDIWHTSRHPRLAVDTRH